MVHIQANHAPRDFFFCFRPTISQAHDEVTAHHELEPGRRIKPVSSKVPLTATACNPHGPTSFPLSSILPLSALPCLRHLILYCIPWLPLFLPQLTTIGSHVELPPTYYLPRLIVLNKFHARPFTLNSVGRVEKLFELFFKVCMHSCDVVLFLI